MADDEYLIRIRTDVRFDGALFDFRGRRIFRRFSEEVSHDGAEWTLDEVKNNFHEHFRHPTGFYESNVEVHRTASGSYEVWDHGEAGPVYGPWLEGVGSRNLTTRFKGYWSFRKAAVALERHIGEIGDRLFRLKYRDML